MNGEYKVILYILKDNKQIYKLINGAGEVAGTGLTLKEACKNASVEYYPHKGVVDEVFF